MDIKKIGAILMLSVVPLLISCDPHKSPPKKGQPSKKAPAKKVGFSK